MHRPIRDRLGLPKGFRLVLKLERCNGIEELRAFALNYCEALRREHGEPMVMHFCQRLAVDTRAVARHPRRVLCPFVARLCEPGRPATRRALLEAPDATGASSGALRDGMPRVRDGVRLRIPGSGRT